jgi:hydroxymethylglutaryl-CoA lyase
MLKLTECPRDAMQGLHDFIPTDVKVNYINQLLTVGFDTIDFGSFVSPKAIPQMKDTAEVLKKLDLKDSKSKLLAIIANERGAKDAFHFEEIDFLGFPFSISETFQQRNTNSSIEESLKRVEAIQNGCLKNNKQLVVYISMAFGNPYGDVWHPDVVTEWAEKLAALDIAKIALSDTVGVSTPENISSLFAQLIPELPNIRFGAHLHTTPDTWEEKVAAAYNNGCIEFDGAIKGFGGCPMAADELTGNMPTEKMVEYFFKNNIETGINRDHFSDSVLFANQIFPV